MTAAAVPFGPIDIAFDETLLRPRPWTLAQSEWSAELADGRPLLEVGCGAGHIGLAAAALSGARLVQVDRDPAACRWAGINAEANGLASLVEQRCGPAQDVLGEAERFGVIIADPPYVPSAEVHLYPEDPIGAIDGGADGLDSVRSFLAGIAGHVEPKGSVVLQVRGLAQVEQLEAWLRDPAAPAFVVRASRDYSDVRALTRLEESA